MERFFHIRARGSTPRREALGGVSTFLLALASGLGLNALVAFDMVMWLMVALFGVYFASDWLQANVF